MTMHETTKQDKILIQINKVLTDTMRASNFKKKL